MARNLNKVIKNSKFVEIKKGKHLCSIECADDVNITFKKFIDENNVLNLKNIKCTSTENGLIQKIKKLLKV